MYEKMNRTQVCYYLCHLW